MAALPSIVGNALGLLRFSAGRVHSQQLNVDHGRHDMLVRLIVGST
jgi:hypothetical protein